MRLFSGWADSALSPAHPLVCSVAEPASGSSPNRAGRRRLARLEQAAEYQHCSVRTVRNHISKGLYPAYRIPGTRGILVDLDDIDRAMQLIPALRRSDKPKYGAKADVRVLPAQPVVVEGGD